MQPVSLSASGRRLLALILLFFSCLVSVASHAAKYQNYAPYLGDLNGDGTQDYYFHGEKIFLIIGGKIPLYALAPPSYALYFNPTTGTYSSPTALTLTDSQIASYGLGEAVAGVDYIVAGDLSGDGRPDLVIQGNASPENMVVLLSAYKALPTVATIPQSGTFTLVSGSVTVADYNLDGAYDLYIERTGNPVSGNYSIAYGDASGQFVSLHSLEVPLSWEDADSDLDGFGNGAEVLAGSDPHNNTSHPPLQIQQFTASPGSISEAGKPVELNWVSQGALTTRLYDDATGVELTNLSASGSLTVNPQFTSRYTLTLQGPDAELAKTLTVTLEQAAPNRLWPSNVKFNESEHVPTSVTVAEDGSTYVGSFDKNFYKISPNGEVSWVVEDFGVVTSKAAMTLGRVIFASNGDETVAGRVCAMSPDKVEYWHFETESAVIGSPVICNGGNMVYVVTYDGKVHALDLSSGQEKWQYQLPSGQTVAATPTLTGPLDARVLLIRTVENQVFAIDCREREMITASESADERVLWTRNLAE